mgnify:CR=1 FL=1
MDIREIKETPIWKLFEKGRNYHRMTGVYVDTDRNYRFYNGNQWEGAKLGDVEPVQLNFIKPIVKYKCSVIHDNLYAIKYSSENYENKEFRQQAEKICDMLNRRARQIWEKDKLDFKGRRVTKDAAINDEGIIYVNFDTEKMMPVNERIKKNDIYYGNENSDEIQEQPYILIRKRLPVVNAVELALSLGMSESKQEAVIIGDNDTFEQSGESAKQEVDDMVTIVYKLFKDKGTVKYSVATRWASIAEDIDTGLSLYPVAHIVWEEKEGSARGEGEVRGLIANQIEVNKTLMRRVLTVKTQAYPLKVVDTSKIANPQAVNIVGGVIRTNGAPVDDVHKAVGTLQPAQMSPDVEKLQEGLVQVTRELAGAGDVATGQVNPESASGRAILAVQQASQAPMTEQKETYKNFIEDIAKIWLEYLIVYAQDGLNLEQEVTDEQTGEKTVEIVNVPQSALEQLQAVVKIDVTPKSVYDRFAQEQTIENMLVQGMFNIQRLPEFEAYVDALDDDAVAPKVKLKEIVEKMRATQLEIAEKQARAQIMQQRAQQFLMDDPDAQAAMMAEAAQQLPQGEEIPEETMQLENNPDDI